MGYFMNDKNVVITRKMSLQDLPEESDPIVQSIHLSVTAGERHTTRVVAARAAAERYLRALGAEPTPELVGALAACESNGVGGPGGYSGHSTDRMSWASSLGTGRRNAHDGAAWSAAIDAIALEKPWPHQISKLLDYLDDGPDLRWPLALALRSAYEMRHFVERATEWAEVARKAAALCEPDDDAGRLAARYGLETLRRLLYVDTVMRTEIIAAMVGVPESEVAPQLYRVGIGDIFLAVEDVTDFEQYDGYGPARRVRVGTRVWSPDAADALIRRAWSIRETVDHDALAAVHGGLLDAAFDDPQLEARRAEWDAPAEAPPTPGNGSSSELRCGDFLGPDARRLCGGCAALVATAHNESGLATAWEYSRPEGCGDVLES